MASGDIGSLQEQLRNLKDSINALDKIKNNQSMSSMSPRVYATRNEAKAAAPAAPIAPEAKESLSENDISKMANNREEMSSYVANLVSSKINDAIRKAFGL